MIGRAAFVKRRVKSDAEKPFWISYADLMTALMVLFLVAMSVAMMTVTYNAEDVERQKLELEEKNGRLNSALELLEAQKSQLEADKQRLKLIFNSWEPIARRKRLISLGRAQRICENVVPRVFINMLTLNVKTRFCAGLLRSTP